MAQRRMFSLKIIDTDNFIDMPISTRLLYYDLSMRADDDGFVSSPKKIIKIIGASTDDLKLLRAKDYIIAFENGVCVIKDWRIHNYIQKDRYQRTMYTKEMEQLTTDRNRSYNINKEELSTMDTKYIHSVHKMDTQVRLGKVRIGKDRINNNKISNNKEQTSEKKEKLLDCVLLSASEQKKLMERFSVEGFKERVRALNDGIMSKGYKYKSHYHTILSWERKNAKTS